LPDSAAAQAVRRAVEQAEDQEDEHVAWAEQTWQEAMLAQLTPGVAAG
jgi:demethoxyubiquinone hydroxylase (CLK1/Coq7/Cat5 family)